MRKKKEKTNKEKWIDVWQNFKDMIEALGEVFSNNKEIDVKDLEEIRE